MCVYTVCVRVHARVAASILEAACWGFRPQLETLCHFLGIQVRLPRPEPPTARGAAPGGTLHLLLGLPALLPVRRPPFRPEPAQISKHRTCGDMCVTSSSTATGNVTMHEKVQGLFCPKRCLPRPKPPFHKRAEGRRLECSGGVCTAAHCRGSCVDLRALTLSVVAS